MRMPLNEPHFIINTNTRSITVPEEFNKNGYQYYIEEGWIKGYKWPRDLDVGTIPIAGDKEKLHILNNLIYFFQKGHFRIYFMELSDDNCWGYQVYYVI